MKRILIVAFAALALGATVASAQTTATASIAVTVPAMLKITSDGADIAFAAITATNIELSETVSSTGGPTLTTKGNIAYKVTATAPDFTMANPLSVADAGAYVKPASDASVKVGATTKTIDAGTALYTRARGTSVDPVSGTLKINLADPAADFSTVVTFTIAAN